MSRTYRLKRYKSKISTKFVDSQCTVHNAVEDTRLSFLIVHVVFAYPCKYVGQPVVKYADRKDRWDYMSTEEVDHTNCMPSEPKTHRSWHWRSNNPMTHMMEMLSKTPRFAVANTRLHEYIKTGRRYRKAEQFFRRSQRKAARREDNMHLAKIHKSGEYDVAQSTVCYSRYW